MIRLLFFSILIFVSVNVFSQKTSDYNNIEGRYAFTPLAGWTVRINGSESSVYAPADGDMDAWDEKVEFSKTDGEDIELSDAFDFYIKTDFPAAYGNFKLINQGTEQINGLEAKWASFTFSAYGTAAKAGRAGDSILTASLQAVFYVVKKNNSLYLVNGVTEKSLFPKFDPSFRAIIRTLRIKE
jgi:hypothetical protein